MSPSRSIPYVDLKSQNAALTDELLAAARRVIEESNFILGPEVERFENAFAELCGSRRAVGLNSGTDALLLALKAYDIGPGDEVITVPNTFVSTVSAIALAGARPVLVDVCEDYNIDPTKIEAAITPNTKAIIPVHLTGRVCRMDEIAPIARKHDLIVIEDSAQAVAATYEGKTAGSFGHVGCFSLHPLKTLGACGDGGAVVSDDEGILEKIKLYRNLGLQTRENAVLWSSNSRLDSLQAALLLVKLKYLARWTDARRQRADWYRDLLGDVGQVVCPAESAKEKPVYHTYIIQAERRDALKEFLLSREIGTAVHYPICVHQQAIGRSLGYADGSFPVAEKLAGRILSLPVYPELEHAQVRRVAECIKEFYAQAG